MSKGRVLPDLTPTKGMVATLAAFVALALIGAGTVIGWLVQLV